VLIFFYSIFYLLIDFVVGSCQLLLFLIYYKPAVWFISTIWISATWWQLLIVIGLTLLLQLIGHVVFQHAFPAFRLFEATITTPFFMMWLFVNSLTGYKQEFLEEVIKKSQKWKPNK
jgi:uncharacterized membrane protein YGL010W